MRVQLLAVVLIAFGPSCGTSDPPPPSDAGVQIYVPALPDIVVAVPTADRDSR
jgi:hypothetical protein